MEVIGLEDDVLAQLQKLQSAQLGSNIIGQLVMDCIVKPPKEGDPSYKQFMEVLMHYLPTASQSAFCLLKVNNRNTRTRSENMFKGNNKDTRTTPISIILMSLLLILNIFHTFF